MELITPVPVVMLAVMVEVPDPVRVAVDPVLKVATLLLLLVQVTSFERSEVVPSAKVPVAVNCSEPWLRSTEGVLGVMAMELNWLEVTVKEALPVMESWLAEIVVVPVPMV